MASYPRKILVVDDLPDWRATMRGVLDDAGYQVQAAGSSAEALRYLSEQNFDLALLDMRLDETDEDNVEGLALARRIRELRPEIKIIIITGYGSLAMAEQALVPDRAGKRLVDDFVEKTQTDQLVSTIKRILK